MNIYKSIWTVAIGVVISPLYGDELAPATPAKKPKPKPEWQYDFQEIRVSIPTADEPRVKSFDRDSILLASKYLDDGAVAWIETRKCIACHTPGAYMVDRSCLTPMLGKPSERVYREFVDTIQAEVPATKEKDGVTYYSQAERAVWRAAGLVQYDRYVNHQTTDASDRALRMMLMQLSSHGGYMMPDSVEIPYETTDYELSQHALRAIVEAPNWLAELKEPEFIERVARLKRFLKETLPRHDYDRALRIGVAALAPELVSDSDRQSDLEMLWEKQHEDGGWSTRDMSKPWLG
jgi:hypothetical protein